MQSVMDCFAEKDEDVASAVRGRTRFALGGAVGVGSLFATTIGTNIVAMERQPTRSRQLPSLSVAVAIWHIPDFRS